MPEQAGGADGPDYYLVKLIQPYDPNVPGSVPAMDTSTPPVPRFFPANVKVRDHSTTLNDTPVNPNEFISPTPLRARTAEFNSNGTMGFRVGPGGTVCVTIDGDPQRRITGVAATSRIKVKEAYNESLCS